MSSSSSSSSFVTIDLGSSVIATSTVMPTFGLQDRLQSRPVSLFVRQDGIQLQSNQGTRDGFELLSSRASRQIGSGHRLEQLEQMVESIALRLGLFVYLNRKTNMADIHQNLRIIVFRMTLARTGRIHRGNGTCCL